MHIMHPIEHAPKIIHGIFHPQENRHGILSSKGFSTMESVIHEAVDALACKKYNIYLALGK